MEIKELPSATESARPSPPPALARRRPPHSLQPPPPPPTHAVTADQVQVRVTRVQLLTNRGDVPRVVVIVNRIGLLLTNDAAIDEIAFLRQPDLNQLALCELDQVLIARIPQSIVFETEILQTVANLIGLGH